MNPAMRDQVNLISLTSTEPAPHFADFQRTMLDATPDCIKLLSKEGAVLTMNRAGCLALNVPLNSEFGMQWIPLLSSDVHAVGLEALKKAAAGEAARFPGKSESPSLMHWDNLLTPVVDDAGEVRYILCVSRDVTAKVELEQELEDAANREKLLYKEMQHRIKNEFSVMAALILIAEKEAARGAPGASATKILRGKLAALARASDATFAENSDQDQSLEHFNLKSLVDSVLQPYGNRCIAGGDHVEIKFSLRTIFALFLHELATNSVKYGSLSNDNGIISVRWESNAEALDLTWTETGGPPITGVPDRSGFGREMMDRLAQSAGGSIDRQWPTSGLVGTLHLPKVACA